MIAAAEQDGWNAGSVRVRVRYPETDRMGVAYHAHYLVWFELGRTEWMREIGLAYAELEDRDGLHFPVVDVAARYHAPARYDDLLWVRTRLSVVGGARVRFEYRLQREGEDRVLASGHTVHAVVSREGRPRRVPRQLRERFREWKERNE